MGYGLFKINPIKGKMFWMPEQRTDESFINPWKRNIQPTYFSWEYDIYPKKSKML